jgi:hypothetical protein
MRLFLNVPIPNPTHTRTHTHPPFIFTWFLLLFECDFIAHGMVGRTLVATIDTPKKIENDAAHFWKDLAAGSVCIFFFFFFFLSLLCFLIEQKLISSTGSMSHLSVGKIHTFFRFLLSFI